MVYTKALHRASLGYPAVDDDPYQDAWGRFYSAFSPVFNSSGKVAGVIAADFNAEWYEERVNENQRTIIVGCVIFVTVGVALTLFLTRQYSHQMNTIERNVSALGRDLDALTREFIKTDSPDEDDRQDVQDDSIQALSKRISGLRKGMQQYIKHARTQANSMITALASDYRSVYHVNLDENDGVCYRSDPNDKEQTPEGIHFPYMERFTWYAEHVVTDKYREGFLHFINPDHIRSSLATQPLIAYRYLANRYGREYYEMIRVAGVRRAEDRDDHIVHSIGMGFTEIDAEMRDTLMKNEALAEALSMAEEANKAKTAFLSSMSHEIRTPMNAIIGLNTLALHDQTLQPQTREYMEKIGGSARHLLGLINDILDMSRIESGRMVLRKEEFSFSAMLEQINTMVMSQCSDKGLNYECRILSSVDDYYIGDDMKLKEVLINILSNAIKFTDAPGHVTLTIERTAVFEDQSTLRFIVKDTGIGMDKSFLPKIFDSFSQEDSSTRNKYGSTGLGMAITKNIVDMMNGTISVESEKGVGTEFTVVITLRNSEHQNQDHEDSVDLSSLRVLVVDDEDVAAEHARMVLDEAGIRALDRPDAQKIPIIALTANAFDEDVQRSLQVGMNAHLTKPVESEHLYQTLEELVYDAEN